MLHSVPNAINALASQVMAHHPNSMDIVLYRKAVTRTAPFIAGQPTIGGMTSLSSTDEEQIEYIRLGRGHAIPAEPFQASRMVKSTDANLGQPEARFIIQSVHPSGHQDHFTPKDHDVFLVLIDGTEDGPAFAYEIVSTETTTNIYPFNIRYVCQLRDDVDVQ